MPAWTPDRRSRAARDRAEELQCALSPIEQKYRTIAVLFATDGSPRPQRYVSSSYVAGLKPAQAAMIRRTERQAPRGTGHAEAKGLRAADVDERDPIALGVSRPICPNCRSEIIDRMGTVQGVARATWP